MGLGAQFSGEDTFEELFIEMSYVQESERIRGVPKQNAVTVNIHEAKVVILGTLVVEKLSFVPASHPVEGLTDSEVFDVVFELSEFGTSPGGSRASTLERLRELLDLDGHTLQMVFSLGKALDLYRPEVDGSAPGDGACNFSAGTANVVACQGLAVPAAALSA